MVSQGSAACRRYGDSVKWKLHAVYISMDSDFTWLDYRHPRNRYRTIYDRQLLRISGLDELRCQTKVNLRRHIQSRIKRGKWDGFPTKEERAQLQQIMVPCWLYA